MAAVAARVMPFAALAAAMVLEAVSLMRTPWAMRSVVVVALLVGSAVLLIVVSGRRLRRELREHEERLLAIMRREDAAVVQSVVRTEVIRAAQASATRTPRSLGACVRLMRRVALPSLAARSATLCHDGRLFTVAVDGPREVRLARRREPLSDAELTGTWISLRDPATGRPLAAGLVHEHVRAKDGLVSLLDRLNAVLGGQVLRFEPLGSPAFESFLVRVFIQMLPLIGVCLVFAHVQPTLAAHAVGSLTVSELIVAIGFSVPWMASMVCLPLYFAVGADDGASERQRQRQLPAAFLRALPPVAGAAAALCALVGLVVGRYLGWDDGTTAAYTGGCMLHLVFSLALVYAYLAKDVRLWLAGWVVYVGCFLAWPLAWYLPSLAAGATLLGTAAARVHEAAPRAGARSGLAAYLARGFLLGSIFWGDKVVYAMKEPSYLTGGALLFTLLPASLAFNYHHAKIAPSVERFRAHVLRSLYRENLPLYLFHRDASCAFLRQAMMEIFLVAGSAVLLALPAFAWTFPGELATGGASVVAGWFLLLETVFLNVLVAMSRLRLAYGSCVLHLVLLAAGLSDRVTPAAFATASLVYSATAAAVLGACLLKVWHHPEYGLFWARQSRW